MPAKSRPVLRVAFVVGGFPIISQTFVIDQIADLLERGIDVRVFSFEKGDTQNISTRYESSHMDERSVPLYPPASLLSRIWGAIPKAFCLLRHSPLGLFRACNVIKLGREAWSLRLLYTVAPFAGTKFDVVHCHFGDVALKFLKIKDVLGIDVPIVTTLYGHDVSALPKRQGAGMYQRLRHEGNLFLVMSEDMKRRVLAYGFQENKVRVLPVSIDVASYPFCERRLEAGKPVEIISVGRFVEKKGFDDLLRALAIVRKKTKIPFRCSIVGGGPLEENLRGLTGSLGLNDCVTYKGYMRNQDIISFFKKMHFMVQASKTASDGDME